MAGHNGPAGERDRLRRGGGRCGTRRTPPLPPGSRRDPARGRAVRRPPAAPCRSGRACRPPRPAYCCDGQGPTTIPSIKDRTTSPSPAQSPRPSTSGLSPLSGRPAEWDGEFVIAILGAGAMGSALAVHWARHHAEWNCWPPSTTARRSKRGGTISPIRRWGSRAGRGALPSTGGVGRGAGRPPTGSRPCVSTPGARSPRSARPPPRPSGCRLDPGDEGVAARVAALPVRGRPGRPRSRRRSRDASAGRRWRPRSWSEHPPPWSAPPPTSTWPNRWRASAPVSASWPWP